MKTVLRLAALALAASLACGAALAQDAPNNSPAAGAHHGAADPQQQLDRLTKRLQLSPDQVAKIQPILQSRQQQAEAVRSDSSLKGADRRAKLLSIMQDADSQLQAVLTDTQRQQYQQWREKAMQRRMEQHATPNAGSGSGS